MARQIDIRSLMIALFVAIIPLFAHGQDQGLVRDFDKLSAKERARIAKEEEEAAHQDPAFQAIMAVAEDLFRERAYEASMSKFKEARTMRPYNVYPKVKIQDLEILIAKRDAEQAASKVEAAPKPAANGLATEVVRSEPPAVVPVTPEKRVVAAPVVRSPQPRSTPPAKRSTARSEMPRSVPVDLEEGEEVYKEGRSVVVERRVIEERRLVVYRKVSHPWGEVNHFREGVAIPAHAYQHAMEGR